jgi:hypothetical protein
MGISDKVTSINACVWVFGLIYLPNVENNGTKKGMLIVPMSTTQKRDAKSLQLLHEIFSSWNLGWGSPCWCLEHGASNKMSFWEYIIVNGHRVGFSSHPHQPLSTLEILCTPDLARGALPVCLIYSHDTVRINILTFHSFSESSSHSY